MRSRLVLALCLAGLALAALAALSAGTARAADECKGLRICLSVEGPWVAVSPAGVDYELSCPLAGYVVAGLDARVAAGDVDVSFEAELGSPVGPAVTTRRNVVFHAVRGRPGVGMSSFQPFIGCIPRRGGGGRTLTGVAVQAAGITPVQVLRSVVVNKPIRSRTSTVRVSCPARTRLLGSTHATAFRQSSPPSSAQIGGVRIRRFVVDGVVVARITAAPVAGTTAEVQVRAICARVT